MTNSGGNDPMDHPPGQKVGGGYPSHLPRIYAREKVWWVTCTDNSTHVTTRPNLSLYLYILCSFITFYTGKQITSNKIKP